MNNSILKLPKRAEKPRRTGLTSVHDVSMSCHQLEGILEDFHEFIDIAKLGVGTAVVTPNLSRKIELYKKYDVQVYFGGTLFEKFHYHNRIEEYRDFMIANNVDMVEVSTGTIDIDIDKRVELIEFFKPDFRVLSEVGSKDNDKVMSPSMWISEINTLLEAGCEYVITEGRNSGTAGVYRPSGEIRSGLIYDIIEKVDPSRLIFEAPTSKGQMYFINQVGCNVNLGNVNPNELLLLETQRLGLRSETFFLDK